MRLVDVTKAYLKAESLKTLVVKDFEFLKTRVLELLHP